jgi:plastocyanin
MNKIFAMHLLLLGLIIYVHAADIMVNVGNAKGENVFEPAKVMANPGDNVCITIFLFIFFLS